MARRKDIENKLIGRIRPVRADGMFILQDEHNVEEKSEGGILLPPRPQASKIRQATVIAVGRDVDDPKVGDRVVFNMAYGNRLPHEDERHCRLLYLTTNQVEGVLEGDDKVE